MNRAEGNISVGPPITFTPLASRAAPLEGSTSNSSFEASFADLLVALSDKVLNLA